jgi:hypothetical protein
MPTSITYLRKGFKCRNSCQERPVVYVQISQSHFTAPFSLNLDIGE